MAHSSGCQGVRNIKQMRSDKVFYNARLKVTISGIGQVTCACVAMVLLPELMLPELLPALGHLYGPTLGATSRI
jgi:hypothetical protein